MNVFEVSSFTVRKIWTDPKILKVGKNNVTTSPLLWRNFAYFSLVPSIRADRHDPWPVSCTTRDPWRTPRPWNESITTTYESWWVRYYCILFSAIWNSGYGICSICTVSLVVYTAVVTSWTQSTVLLFVTFLWTSYTFTPHLIMGQVFYGTDPWSTWCNHICWPIWPANPLSALPFMANLHFEF